jgi:hypothetical protein
MDAKRIEGRLKLHIANVALAAVGRKEGDLREAKDALLREVERIAYDAQLEVHSR